MSVSVQQADFDIGAEIKALTDGQGDIGAVVSFTGLVRDLVEDANVDGKADRQPPTLSAITLEHYPAMTVPALRAIEAEAMARWPVRRVRIIHRFGTLHIGENIVLVLTASAHRQAAFEAANFIMDYLKVRAPFWKKETRANDVSTWVEAREHDARSAAQWQSRPHKDGR
ncbi:MAG: molybdenum cofactor biosynthesis protein MoaE [Pseudomonadota bacterium]